MPLGSRLSDSVIKMNLWEHHTISNLDLFSLDLLSRNFKETIAKYASNYDSSLTQMHKSSLQMLLDENASQASGTSNTDNEPAVDIDWLDHAYKSSVDEQSLSDDADYVYSTLK